MPVAKAPSKRKSKRSGNVFSKLIGTAIKDGSDYYYVDVIGSRNGPLVRFRVVSGGEEVLRLHLEPKIATILSIALSHATYLAHQGSDVVDLLWRYQRSGAANVAESKVAESAEPEEAELEPVEEEEEEVAFA